MRMASVQRWQFGQERKSIYVLSSELGKAQSPRYVPVLSVDRTLNDHFDKESGAWVKRSHGEENFYPNQFMTGHGYFRACLYRMSKVMSGTTEQEKVMFSTRYSTVQIARKTSTMLGVRTPDNIIGVTMKDEDSWVAVAAHI